MLSLDVKNFYMFKKVNSIVSLSWLWSKTFDETDKPNKLFIK